MNKETKRAMWMHIVFINVVLKALNYPQLEETNVHFYK